MMEGHWRRFRREAHEPAGDIDTAAVDSLKALDPKRPIREAEVVWLVTERGDGPKLAIAECPRLLRSRLYRRKSGPGCTSFRANSRNSTGRLASFDDHVGPPVSASAKRNEALAPTLPGYTVFSGSQTHPRSSQPEHQDRT
jgi:hypothetical protein